MGRKKTAEADKAYELFTETKLTQKEIAAIVGVSQQQMSKWVSAGDWETMRSAQQVTVQQLIKNAYSQIARLNKKIADEQHGIPEPAQVDMLNKIAASIEKLTKKFNLSAYHQVLTECLEWMSKADADKAKGFGPLMLDFLKEKAQKLDNDQSLG